MESKSSPISTEESPSPTTGEGEVLHASSKWGYWKHYLTSRDGWIGDYVGFNYL